MPPSTKDNKEEAMGSPNDAAGTSDNGEEELCKKSFNRARGYGPKECRRTTAVCLELVRRARASPLLEDDSDTSDETKKAQSATQHCVLLLPNELTQRIVRMAYPLLDPQRDPLCPGLYVGVCYCTLFILNLAVGPDGNRVVRMRSKDHPRHLQWNENPGQHYTDHLSGSPWSTIAYDPSKKLTDKGNLTYFCKRTKRTANFAYKTSSSGSRIFKLQAVNKETTTTSLGTDTGSIANKQEFQFHDTIEAVPAFCRVRGFIAGEGKYFRSFEGHRQVTGYAERTGEGLRHGISEWSIVLNLDFDKHSPLPPVRLYLVRSGA